MTGWVSYDRDLQQHGAVIAAMTSTMAQRGPDDSGIWINGHVGLGHRRLAIIDLAGGLQPMLAEEQGQPLACLVYAGEIYNFLELRSELEWLGHRFRTRSDTEVLLRGYLQWGERVAERLNGMFAFAIWDTRREELLLIRDRMGIKPLYFFPTVDGVIFGSEPKALLAHPLVQPRVNRDGFRELLVTARNPGRTVYSGMHEVRAGEIVRVSRNGIAQRLYWTLQAHEHEHDLPRTIETVAELLDDIVRRQIVSDVPVCSLLSGGLDSSAITALAHRAAKDGAVPGFRSFSVDFTHEDGAAFRPDVLRDAPDTPYVRDFVAHTGCEHSHVVLDSAELATPQLVRAVVRASDFPLNVSGDLFSSMYRLFQTIRSEFSVALSGESADEIFGGYSWFHNPKVVNWPHFPWFAISEGGMDVFARDFLERLDLEGFRADSYAQALAEVPVEPSDGQLQRRMRELSHLHATRFVRFLLDRKDRISMALGLEVRVPYCDHRLVEYAFNIPWRMHTFDGREKSILRAAARELLPTSIIERKKCPYPSTQDPRYEEALRTAVAAIMADRSHPARRLFDVPAVEAILSRSPGPGSAFTDRVNLERVHSLSTWIKDYGVLIDA